MMRIKKGIDVMRNADFFMEKKITKSDDYFFFTAWNNNYCLGSKMFKTLVLNIRITIRGHRPQHSWHSHCFETI